MAREGTSRREIAWKGRFPYKGNDMRSIQGIELVGEEIRATDNDEVLRKNAPEPVVRSVPGMQG